MKKIDTIVVAPHFYTMEGAGVGYHGDAAMAVDGGKILEVGDRSRILVEYTAEETIILDHHMVLPGFIDGHMHTACNFMRGLAQDTNSWMMFGLQPFDNAVNDKERDAGSRVAILEAMWIWNDYLLPTLILDVEKYKTISMLIQFFRGSYGRVEMGPMMACIMLTVLPIIILYLACQKYIIEGVVAGAVKG